nr:putative ribonuclease H-like domain-containing protein [Tanacetum cinerariifolium]
MHAMKRIFRYLKGQPTLGLSYPKDSPLVLITYSDNDYAGASLDRKSTTGGCLFLGSRLISWQCKKQTIVANSTTEAKYIAASSYYGKVFWLQNQLLYYGYNFMQTKIHVDNESIICVVKNLVYHSKTKHIEIKHHFIRDSYEKRLIEMVKIHTNSNVADLHTKAFDVTSSKTVNFVKQIHAIVDGKAGVISESLVRSDLLFDDEDGITCLTNDEIFENVPMMGFEPLSTKLTFQKDKDVNQEEGDRVERAITTDASLEAAQDSDNIIKTKTITMPNKLKKKEMIQLSLDEELAQKLYAKELAKEGARQEQERYNLEKALELQRQLDQRKEDVPKGNQAKEIDWNDPQTELLKKLKKKEMIQLSLDEELAQKLYAKELAKEGARQEQERYNLEKALELQRQLDQRKEDVPKGNQAKEIDWNDPQICVKRDQEETRPTQERIMETNQVISVPCEPKAVQTPGSRISILLAVGIPSTGSGNLYCQWEISPSKSILEDEDVMDKGVVDRLKKRKADDADRDKGPPARPD